MKCAGESQQLAGIRWWPKDILRMWRHSHTDCLLQKTRVHWDRRHLPKLVVARLGIIRDTRLEGRRKEGRACCKGRRTSVRILSHFFLLNCVWTESLFRTADVKDSSAIVAFLYYDINPYMIAHDAEAVWQEIFFSQRIICQEA